MGIAEAMMHSQDIYNACERAKSDNMAWSVGKPIMYINTDRMQDPKDILDVHPGSVIRGKDSDYKGSERVLDFIQIPNVSGSIENTQANILALIQDQTGIPNSLMGMGGDGNHNRTLGGASLQYNSAIVPMRGVASNLEEDVIVPFITKIKEFLDVFSDDETIKGDMKVNARGVSGLIARETTSTLLDNFLNSASQNQTWAQQIDMNRIGQIKFRYSGLEAERLTYTPFEVEQNAKKASEMEAEMEMRKAQGMAQIDTEAAKQRAETSPVDILLQIMSEAPEGSPIKTQAMKELLGMKGMLTPDMESALNIQMEIDIEKSDMEMALSEDELKVNMEGGIGESERPE
jgi:hypothetical protein